MACPKDCAMSDWTDGKCSVTCGEGSQSRFRTVLSQAVGGGKACSAADGDTVKETKLTKCTMPACAVAEKVADTTTARPLLSTRIEQDQGRAGKKKKKKSGGGAAKEGGETKVVA